MDKEISARDANGARGKIPRRFISLVELRKRQNDHSATERDNGKTYGKKLVTDADRTAIATIVIAVAAFLSFGAAILQYVVLSGQLTEMKSASTQTQQMVNAAGAQAEAAKSAADAAQRSLIADERAWVGPQDASIIAAPVVGKDLTGTISYHNSGREPARDGTHGIDAYIVPVDADRDGTLADLIAIHMTRCLMTPERANGEVTYPTTGFSGNSVSFTIPKEMIDGDVVSGKKVVIVQGCFVYRTVDQARHSAFCFFFRTGTSKPEHLNFCQTGNYAD